MCGEPPTWLSTLDHVLGSYVSISIVISIHQDDQNRYQQQCGGGGLKKGGKHKEEFEKSKMSKCGDH